MRGQYREIPLSEIDLGKRGRILYEDIEQLGESIRSSKLIHPISVIESPEGELMATMVDKSKQYLLEAGGRRYRAHEYLKAETIPCIVWPPNITVGEFRFIELEENLQRKNLTWQEEIEMRDEVVKLMRDIEGNQAMTLTAIAIKSGISEKTLSKDLKLKAVADKIPEVAKCATRAEANKLVNQLEEQAVLREKAKREAERLTKSGADERKKAMFDSYIVGDALEMIKKVPNNSMDFIELDPPYGIDYEELHGGRTDENPNVANFHEWGDKEYGGLLAKVAKECYRVSKELSWGVCWCSIWRLDETNKVLAAAGYDVCKSPLIWDKSGSGRNRSPSSRFTVDYEVALYFRKGKAQLNVQGPSSVFGYMTDKNSRHPTQKPVGLLCSVLDKFCAPGSKILVPFLGSGNTLLAAAEIKCLAFGFDLSQEYKDGYTLALEERFMQK